MAKHYPIFDLKGPNTVELTLEQRYETLESIFVHQLFQLYRIIGRRYGWEAANEILLEVPASSVPLIAEGYKRKFGLDGEGAALISQVMQAEFQAEGSDVAVLEESPDEAVFEVDCSFGAMLQSGTYDDVKITPGLCEAGCADWMGEVGATVDPQVDAEREAWMGDGAPRCRFNLRARAAKR
ncbi:MAG: hypothetical protein U0R71_10705 [Solirubrobacterales bacterium]